MDSIEALQLIALKNIEKPDVEAQLRRIKRFFSTTFHTPLADVENLDLDFVLMHYFEHVYAQLKPEDFGKLRNNLLYKTEIEEINEEDDAWAQQEMDMLLEEEKKLKEKKLTKEEVKVIDEKFPEIKMDFK